MEQTGRLFSTKGYMIDNEPHLHEAEGLYAAVQTRDSDIWYALYQHADFRQCVADIYT